MNVAQHKSRLSKHMLSCSRPQSPHTDWPQVSPQGADGKLRHRGCHGLTRENLLCVTWQEGIENHLPPLVFRHLLDCQYGECSRYPSFASRVTLRETEKLKSRGPHGWSPPAHCGICQTASAAGSDACSRCT